MLGIGLPELVIIALVIPFIALWIWMIVDVARKEPPGSDKVIWRLIVLFGGCIDAVVYLIFRRPKRLEQFGR